MTYVVVDKEQLETDLGIVCDAIREKGRTSEQLAFPLGMKSAVEAIQSGGTNYLDYVTKLTDLFKNAQFEENTEITIAPKILNLSSGDYIDAYSICESAENLKKIKLIYDNEKPYRITSAFKECREIEEIDFGEKIVVNGTSTSQIFYNAVSLKKITSVLDFSLLTSNSSPFTGCASLEYVRLAENSVKTNISFSNSPLLSADSIQSIIDGLADSTGGTARTVTFHKDVKAKLTDEQKTQTTSKNWILA